MKPVVLVPLALALSLTATRAQDRQVVQDEWTARWVSGRKQSWTHRVVKRERDAEQFVVEVTTVARVDSDAFVTRMDSARTDRAGRVLQRFAIADAPWGRTILEVAAVGSGGVGRLRVRDLPVEEVLSARPLVLPRVLTLGGAATVSSQVCVLREVPHLTVQEVRVELEREPDGASALHVDGVVEARWGPDGAPLPVIGEWACTGPSTAARASDWGEPCPVLPPKEAPLAVPGVTLGSLGTAWHVWRQGPELQRLGAINLLHPDGTWAAALIEDGRLRGGSPEERLRHLIAEQAVWGEHALSAPEACTFQGRPAFRFRVRWAMGSVELEGDLYQLDLGTAHASVWAVQPRDLRSVRNESVRAALDALRLEEVPRTR